jgi:glycosyltransferase involved in cell wall biosynthesis
LRGCKVFVLPSRFETFGIVVLEAMGCEKPVVATTAGGIPEIIENGRNGILVEPDNPKALAEALVNLLNNESLRGKTAKNGYATAREQFSFERTAEKYELVLADISRTAKVDVKASVAG